MANDPELNKTVLASPIHFTAFGFGSGLAPFAPGTFGTLAAIPLYLVMNMFSQPVYIGLVLASIIFGFWVCGKSSEMLGVHDHGGIVWDEFAGFFITMIAAPQGWEWILIGFALFRLFDIWKPWPINIIDKKVQGGVGIMMDDVIAGIYAFVCLQIINLYYLEFVK
ncbi:MAG TPA: phosphatidylglycerophosphatase A [Leucothrix mucor]|nr:phosphatidylglycerophosphatase A [Leucothrix mucor]